MFIEKLSAKTKATLVRIAQWAERPAHNQKQDEQRTANKEGLEMSTAKEEVRKLLEQLPDNSSFEDIQYHIYVREKIERGLHEVEQGQVLSQEEVERRMSKWLGG
jgi:hypothetical protein